MLDLWKTAKQKGTHRQAHKSTQRLDSRRNQRKRIAPKIYFLHIEKPACPTIKHPAITKKVLSTFEP